NPPQDFEIVDPGYLGYLYLQWQPPLSLDDFDECVVEYELKYRNIDSESWTALKRRFTHFCQGNAQMDQKFKVRGQKLHIGHHYKGLDHALECSDYTKNNEKNIGCRFPYLESADYKDFYICVNGSSESKPIRSSYFVFQLQNIVKPLPPDYLSLTVKNSEEIILRWDLPRGPIPARCFIYEIELTEDDTTWVTTTVANEMYITKTSKESQQFCFLVRSKVNMYCSDDGIWSEWSKEQCWK
ncbi:Interleukin-13 receptor subunit alpha-2, partial [Galemys pyrenaicus]